MYINDMEFGSIPGNPARTVNRQIWRFHEADKRCNFMKVFIIDSDPSDLEADAWGPYSEEMARKILVICRKAGHQDAEIVGEGLDNQSDKIEAGLLPFQITVDIVGGEPQLPATVSLCWPPAEQEGIQEGTPEGTTYFVWAKNEKDALLRLARINRAAPPKIVEAEA